MLAHWLSRRSAVPSLNRLIFIAAAIGVLVGWLIGLLPEDAGLRGGVLYASTLIGAVFVGLLKMVLIPLIFTSIVVGVASLQAHHQVHRVWITTLLFFAFTTAAAMLVALVAANLFRPGAGMSLAMFADAMQDLDRKSTRLNSSHVRI